MLGSFKKTPKIEFFTNIDMLPEVIPVEHGAKAMPSWWKQTPAATPDTDPRTEPGTVKVCPAFPDLFSAAYIVPLWCDLIFDYNNGEPRARTSAPDLFSVSFHSDGQFLNHAPSSVRASTVAVMKLQSPWYVRTSPGYSVLQLPAFYEFDPRVTVMMGAIRSDVHHEINQQMMVHHRGSFVLERGTPIAMYIPFKREKFAFSVQEITEDFMRVMQKSQLNLMTKFRRGYRHFTE
jgi:hypothetical protein